MGLGSFGSVLVDGHTSALTHRSITLSPTGGFASVTAITDVCDEKGRGQIMAVSEKSQAVGGRGIPPFKERRVGHPILHRQSYLPKIATLNSNARVAQTLEYVALLDRLAEKGFEIQFESHAAAILEKDFPEALTDLEQALGSLTIPIAEIIGSGGGETKGTQRMRRAFNNVGWHKFIFEIRKIINGTEREAISHEIDHVKDFGKYKLALEIEWNNKEGFSWA